MPQRIPLFGKLTALALSIFLFMGLSVVFSLMQASSLRQVSDVRSIESAMMTAAQIRKQFTISRNPTNARDYYTRMAFVDSLLGVSVSDSRIFHLRALKNKHTALFTEYMRVMEMRGLSENSGAEGRFRESVHNIEALVSNLGSKDVLVHMLQARRREKDYIMRREQAYIDLVETNIRQMKKIVASASIDPAAKTTILGLADDYLSDFHTLAKLFATLTTLEQQLTRVETEINSYTATLVENKENKATEAQKAQIVVIAFSLLAAGFFSFILARTITRPILKLKDAAKKVAAGETGVVVSIATHDEIHDLANAFNAMARTIEESNRTIGRQKEQLELRSRTLESSNVELQERTRELEHINQITALINKKTDFDDLIRTFVEQVRIVRYAEVVRALVYDVESDRFRFAASTDGRLEELQALRYTANELERSLLTDATCVSDGIFVTSARPNQTPSNAVQEIPSGISRLIIRVVRDDKVEGFFIFEGDESAEAFSDKDIGYIVALKEHLLAAFIKTKMLGELKQLNDRQNEFLGIATHDLKNPLHAIKGFTELLIEEIENKAIDPEDFLHQLRMISKSATRMTNLIRELLDITAIETGNIQLDIGELDMTDLVSECFAMNKPIATRKNITLVLNDNCSGRILADKHRINEVLDNLISNAIKFTYAGGKVEVFFERNDGKLITHVLDTGQGLDAADIGKAFKGFNILSAMPTGGEESTGLGLAIVKKIIDLHGGSVWVESEKDKGAKFSFSLNLSK